MVFCQALTAKYRAYHCNPGVLGIDVHARNSKISTKQYHSSPRRWLLHGRGRLPLPSPPSADPPIHIVVLLCAAQLFRHGIGSLPQSNSSAPSAPSVSVVPMGERGSNQASNMTEKKFKNEGHRSVKDKKVRLGWRLWRGCTRLWVNL